MCRAVRCAAVLLASLLAATLARGEEAAPTPTAEQVRFFEAQVRPVLVNQCGKCHGAEKQKGGLRLDSRDALLAGGETGPAVVPGDDGESLLLTAVRHEDAALKMPPSKKLADPVIADLTNWVKQGAPWPAGDPVPAATAKRGEMVVTDKDRQHWAFRPIGRPTPPAVNDPAWAAQPIDAFIKAKLDAKKLAPNPPASRLELIRRASYDLTGLPPTPEEVAAFQNDARPEAYEALIDRLLDSPRYGEKWARHWLDLVRFAETNSFERDNPKPQAWRYRDYVIKSLNADKPYDRFLREQLAGDELPDGGPEGLIATGYYRLGIWDDEPADREQARFDNFDDIVATTSQVFLGLTVDCARCHDHKLDPIPQKDYYRLLSFFRNVNDFRNGGPTDLAPIFGGPEARKAYEQSVRDLQRRRDDVQAQLNALDAEFRARFEKEQAGTLASADLDDLHYRYYRDTWDKLPDFDPLKPEDSGSLPRNLFDLSPRTRDDAFGFVFEGTLIVPRPGKYTFILSSDDGSRLLVAGREVVRNDGIHGLKHEISATVELAEGRLPIRLDYFQRRNGLGLDVAWSGPDLPRRSLSAPEKAPARAEPTPTPTQTPRELLPVILSDGARLLGADWAEKYRALRRTLKEVTREKIDTDMALCVTEAGRTAPETFVLLRGNPHVPGDKVEPAFVQVLGESKAVIPQPAPEARSTGRRTVLADWLASPTNPLPARVMANRVWQYHFGRGIVRSSSNFGLQGDRPTHPELLDWLASEFVRQGWRLKPLHRTIMTSMAYRMSSRQNDAAYAADPANDLLWRFDMRRLTAEEIRDSILSVTGTLNLKMYGPGVYPEIPPEVLAGQSIPGKGWGHSPPEEQARRSIYAHVKRSLLVPILESFDVAETDRSTPARFSTTQPTQALAMINSTFLNRQAALLAARLRREAGADPVRQVEAALRLVTTRTPDEAEVRRGKELIETLRTRDGATDELALKAFCLVVLNLNEFVYLD